MGSDAADYGVKVVSNKPVGGRPHWKVVEVTHLSPEANQGRHHVFVDALDEQGRRVPGLKIGWTWEGRRANENAPSQPMDKGSGEPMGNVSMDSPNVNMTVWIEQPGTQSEFVTGLNTKHPDERAANGQNWNSVGHHSFHVVFQRVSGSEPDPQPQPPADLAALRQELAEVRAKLDSIEQRLNKM